MKQILHLVSSKNLYICFCYISLHLAKIGQNLISAKHWGKIPNFYRKFVLGAPLNIPSFLVSGASAPAFLFVFCSFLKLTWSSPEILLTMLNCCFEVESIFSCSPPDVLMNLDPPLHFPWNSASWSWVLPEDSRKNIGIRSQRHYTLTSDLFKIKPTCKWVVLKKHAQRIRSIVFKT